MLPRTVEKVTAFITRPGEGGLELLLIQHAHAGIQIPAGTVEDGEAPEAAALREAAEESGLQALEVRAYLGAREENLPETEHVVAEPTPVYARPDAGSFDWARFRKGIRVRVERHAGDFVQATYEEFDRWPDPQYTTYRITGWVPAHTLAARQVRHFYHLAFTGAAEARWRLQTDQHVFTLFWAPLAALPPLIAPQDRWLEFVPQLK